jgi:hypothetical protein
MDAAYMLCADVAEPGRFTTFWLASLPQVTFEQVGRRKIKICVVISVWLQSNNFVWRVCRSSRPKVLRSTGYQSYGVSGCVGSFVLYCTLVIALHAPFGDSQHILQIQDLTSYRYIVALACQELLYSN